MVFFATSVLVELPVQAFVDFFLMIEFIGLKCRLLFKVRFKLLDFLQKSFLALSFLVVAFGHFEPKFVSFFLELSGQLLNLDVLYIGAGVIVLGILVLLQAVLLTELRVSSITVRRLVDLDICRVGSDGRARRVL